MAGRERLICASAELVDGGDGVRFEVTRRGGNVPAFVVRWRARPLAYINECRHQCTELDWNPGDFFDESKLYLMCATHGALYDPESGLCVSGPCQGARLAPVAVCERDGGVFCTEVG
jgi:nitrite reductase/ring-hydroxylating ferredoxin subunit